MIEEKKRRMVTDILIRLADAIGLSGYSGIAPANPTPAELNKRQVMWELLCEALLGEVIAYEIPISNSALCRKGFPDGLTVQEFKQIVANWPEVNHEDEPTEVWLETGQNRSGVVRAVCPLNMRGGTADILLGFLD